MTSFLDQSHDHNYRRSRADARSCTLFAFLAEGEGIFRGSFYTSMETSIEVMNASMEGVKFSVEVVEASMEVNVFP